MYIAQNFGCNRMINEHITWKYHINYITKKVAKLVGIISKARNFNTQELLMNLYYSLIYPHRIYGNIVWANNYKTRLEKLFQAIRIITFSQ